MERMFEECYDCKRICENIRKLQYLWATCHFMMCRNLHTKSCLYAHSHADNKSFFSTPALLGVQHVLLSNTTWHRERMH